MVLLSLHFIGDNTYFFSVKDDHEMSVSVLFLKIIVVGSIGAQHCLSYKVGGFFFF